jgi:ornithine cyclodeaminase/alanine dehydrogenase-like protein (mu-crystallin family)
MEVVASSADLAMLAVGAGLGLVVYSCSMPPASPTTGPQGASSAQNFCSNFPLTIGRLRVLLRATADKCRPSARGAGALQPSAPPANAPTRQAVQVFDYEYIKANVKEADGIEAVEKAFALLADGKVDVPTPMHIGPLRNRQGDCHIKGGYIDDTATFTVKMATVSFNKNREQGLPPGSGVFCVFSAETGMPLAVFQENRYMTDLRTGAAGAVCVKHLVAPHQNTVAFIGTGIIGRAMCRASNCTAGGGAGWKQGLLYDAHSAEAAQKFADEMGAECGFPLRVCSSAEEACRGADVIFTSTPGSSLVLEKGWLQPHATIIAAGSDQPTKQELPADVVEASQLVTDITAQCKTNGELRSAPRYEALSLDCLASELLAIGRSHAARQLLPTLSTLSTSPRRTA